MLYNYHPISNIATINASVFDEDSLLRAGQTLSCTNASCLISDPSGEAINLLSPFLQEKGYEIRVFDITNPSSSNSYNPFDYIETESHIFSLVDSIMGEGEGEEEKKRKEADPFWSILEKHLLTALCALISESRPKEKRNLVSILTLLRLTIQKEGKSNLELDDVFEQHEKERPNSFAVKEYKFFKNQINHVNILKSVVLHVAIKLSIFNLDSISHLTSSNEKNGIEIEKLFEPKHAIFLSIPKDFSLISSIFFSQFYNLLSEKERR